MKTAFIGAGKVANAFAVYLTIKGQSVDYIHSLSSDEALKMAKLTSSSYCESMKELVNKSDIIFITTGDSVISKVADEIASEFEKSKTAQDKSYLSLSGKTFVHMSGALTSDELSSLKNLGASTYSLHPLQSFADHDKALEEISTTVFSLEGEVENAHIKKILKVVGNEIIYLSKEDKIKYHIAACISSNYLVTLLNSSIELFDQIGIERHVAIKSLMPLIKGAVSNFENLSSTDALTGPIKRADTKTIEKHMDDLEDSNFRKLYEVMGLYTSQLAASSGVDKSKLDQIDKLLKRD